MLWIEDVLDDLKKICEDQGYVEIASKIEETRQVYYAELVSLNIIEFLPKSFGKAKPNPTNKLSKVPQKFHERPRVK